jgi:hypothetical protein
MTDRWRPPTYRPNWTLYVKDWDKDLIERSLNSTIGMALSMGKRKMSLRRAALYIRDAHDGMVEDIVFRTEEFAAHCRREGVDMAKVQIAVALWYRIGMLPAHLFEAIKADLGVRPN